MLQFLAYPVIVIAWQMVIRGPGARAQGSCAPGRGDADAERAWTRLLESSNPDLGDRHDHYRKDSMAQAIVVVARPVSHQRRPRVYGAKPLIDWLPRAKGPHPKRDLDEIEQAIPDLALGIFVAGQSSGPETSVQGVQVLGARVGIAAQRPAQQAQAAIQREKTTGSVQDRVFRGATHCI